MTTSPGADRYKLLFFVPPQHLPDIKAAIFSTGAGRIGNYEQVCFTSPGVGQFKPVDGAKPVIGEVGKLEEVGEVRCELICGDRKIAVAAVEALKRSALSLHCRRPSC